VTMRTLWISRSRVGTAAAFTSILLPCHSGNGRLPWALVWSDEESSFQVILARFAFAEA
jgi:hypothetical protein